MRGRKGRLAIYSDTVGGFGGNGYRAGVLAAAASRDREVCLQHHWQGVTQETWSRFVGSDMSAVTLVTVPRVPAPMNPFVVGDAHGLGRWRAPFVSERVYSEGFEQFISIGHGPPPFNQAKAGAHYTAFPLFRPFETWPFGASGGTGMKARGRHADRAVGLEPKNAVLSRGVRQLQVHRLVDCGALGPASAGAVSAGGSRASRKSEAIEEDLRCGPIRAGTRGQVRPGDGGGLRRFRASSGGRLPSRCMAG